MDAYAMNFLTRRYFVRGVKQMKTLVTLPDLTLALVQ